jgi:uroporphyrinogen-III decarboxylase
MNSRERILTTFDHEEPDCVPTFLQSMMPKFVDAAMERFEDEIEDKDILYIGKDFTMYMKLGLDSGWGASCSTSFFDSDIVKHNPYPDVGKNRSVGPTGRITKRDVLNGHVQSWVDGSVLKSVDDAEKWYETYIKPEHRIIPNAVEHTNSMLRQAGDLLDNFVPSAGLNGVLEPLMEGLGMGLFSRMSRKHKDKIKKFLGWLTKHGVEHTKIAVETDYELFHIADDSAYKHTTMISPEMHRELVVPCYKQMCDIVRKAGKHVFFHSDGFTEPYFPGLIEAGFHGVESLEPMSGMNLKHLKETYGDKLCLIGNIDVSQTLPLGTPADVAAEVKQCIEDAAAGGGYIVSPCTDLTDSVPLDNAIAMVEAVKKYGVYKK